MTWIMYVATELATDVVINVGDTKFYLHKVKASSSTKVHFLSIFKFAKVINISPQIDVGQTMNNNLPRRN
ncbi:hypothetical protein ACLOJK_003615 [Asimina triloba]